MRDYDHVIYHGGCTDGFTAAWLLRHHRPEAEVHAGRYGQPPPAEVAGHVVIADFSYPRDELLELAGRVDRLTILDHHQTALEHLTELPGNVEATFDMDRSGASLTLDWLLADVPLEEICNCRLPAGADELVNYVEDRDLWRFELPASREIAAYILATPLTWPAWDELAVQLADDRSSVELAGAAVMRRDEVLTGQILATARPFELRTPAGQALEVPTAASPYGLGSTVAGELAKSSPAGVGAYYIDYPDRREWGLRSIEDGPDVAAIAEGYGGGGHRHASGFRIDRREGYGGSYYLLG